jgi:hypothetical protein
MTYQLKVIKDYPLGFWPLDESYGTTASDKSGCGNNATYVGSPVSNILPLVSGGISGTNITTTAYITVPITKDYYSTVVESAFGTKHNSDSDFTMEVWFSPSIESTSVVRIFGDTTNNIGIFWENGDIIFKVSATEQIRHRVRYSKKTHHVVGLYSSKSISLYVDGEPVANKDLEYFKFPNSSLSLQIGPSTVSGDTFIVDAPAVYRYTLLPQSIKRHYLAGVVSYPAVQVVYPEQGTYFALTDANKKVSFTYSYPQDKRWIDLLDDYTYYDIEDQYIGFTETDDIQARTFIVNDFVTIPTQLDISTSKVEWRDDIGVAVETSVDNITFLPCVNGAAIPQYKKGSFSNSGKLYIRITMTSSDTSKYYPRLSFFKVSFYRDKNLFANNSGDTITSPTDYALGSLNYPVLSRNYNNGLRPTNGSGFDLNTLSSVKSLEMFFTPLTLAANTLIYGSDPSVTRLAWNGSGAVSKANIAKIYVNGVDVSNQTNISSYLNAEEPHHIVIVFTQPITGVIKFNYESSGGPSNLYKNIAIYEKELTQSLSDAHFKLYIGRPAASITESSFTVTENAIETYNDDWVVLQSV